MRRTWKHFSHYGEIKDVYIPKTARQGRAEALASSRITIKQLQIKSWPTATSTVNGTKVNVDSTHPKKHESGGKGGGGRVDTASPVATTRTG